MSDSSRPRAGFGRFDQPLSAVLRPINWCEPGSTVREMATLISSDGASCAVHLHMRCLPSRRTAGHRHRADFREKVATGLVGADAPVSAIASHPAYMVSDDLSVETALITMVDRGIHHLLTNDRSGRPSGVERVVDVADSSVRNPLLVRNATDCARDLEELVVAARQLSPTLVELYEAGLPPGHLGALHSAMLESVFRKLVEFHTPGTLLEKLTCSWMLLGSVGRRETLPNSDIDTALAWSVEPGAQEPDPADVADAVMPIMKAMPACGLQRSTSL